MQLSLDLNAFKRSDIYTFEYDVSSELVVDSQINRLVVGFSRKGPFNAPVYLPDKKTAKAVFGEIDTQLEKKGSFFHRSLYTCLDEGPVFALNLVPIKNTEADGNDSKEADKTNYMSYSLSSFESNGLSTERLYSSFFNKERFWKPDSEYLLANVNATGSPNKGKLFNIVNLGQTPVSILVRKTKSIPQFNITASEWFGGNDNVPSYVDPNDYISDYFIDVAVVQGNWTDYNKLSIDPIYNEFFTNKGIKKNKLKDFLALPHVVNYGIFTGSIIPELRDSSGSTYTIDTIINNALGTNVGLLVAINKEALEEYNAQYVNYDDNLASVDLVGHLLANTTDVVGVGADALITKSMPNSINFLSYNFGIQDTFNYTFKNTLTEDSLSTWLSTLKSASYVSVHSSYLGKKNGYFNNTIIIQKPIESDGEEINNAYNGIKNMLINGTSLFVSGSDKFKVNSSFETENEAGERILKIYVSSSKLSTQTTDYNSAKAITPTDVEWSVANKELTITVGTQDDFTLNSQIVIWNTNDLTYTYANIKEAATDSTTFKVEFTQNCDTNGLATALSGDYPNEDVANLKFMKHDTPVGIPTSVVGLQLYRENTVVELDTSPDPDIIKCYKNSEFGKAITGNINQSADILYQGSTNYYMNIVEAVDADGFGYYSIRLSLTAPSYSNGSLTGWNYVNNLSTIVSFTNNTFSAVIKDSGISNAGSSRLLMTKIPFVSVSADKKIVYINKSLYDSEILINDYLVSKVTIDEDTNKYRLCRIVKKSKNAGNSNLIEIHLNEPVFTDASNNVIRFINMEEYAQTYTFQYLSGFKMTSWHMPGSQEQLIKILNMLDPGNTNLMEVLKDRNILSFRYLVDTFDGGIMSMNYPKNLLMVLAKERQKCLALMNFPSFKSFANSTDPVFTKEPSLTDPKPILDTYYISTGGNLELNPSYTFSLPDETNGAKFGGYFGPFLMIRENGRNFGVPPSADVSNLFMQKHKAGNPFGIIAGKKRGVISNAKQVGMEYDLTDRDRDNLEPFGLNCIVKRKNSGWVILGNQMAYQRMKSTFNNLHVRDILITIEEDLENLLENYMFELNTNLTRIEIKNKVEAYLDKVRSLGGIYNFEVVLDSTNNTDEVINAKTLVLDIAIEPTIGMQKFINRIHVYGAGGIASLGFNVGV